MTVTSQSMLRLMPSRFRFNEDLCNQLKAQLIGINDIVGSLVNQGEEHRNITLYKSLHTHTLRLLDLLALMENLHGQEKNVCTVEAIISSLLDGAGKIDERFVRLLVSSIESNMSNEKYDPKSLAEDTHVSRSQLYQKIRMATGLSAGALVRKVRLRRATQLLKTTSLAISEVAYKVGFSDQAYFTKCFRAEHAVSPKEYRKLHKADNLYRPFPHQVI